MIYQIAAIPMTLSNLEVLSRTSIASPFECNFSFNCVAVDNVSTDVARRAVPLRQLSFL